MADDVPDRTDRTDETLPPLIHGRARARTHAKALRTSVLSVLSGAPEGFNVRSMDPALMRSPGLFTGPSGLL
jgi:hypothetical protein